MRPSDDTQATRATPTDRMRRDQNMALGCAVAVALLVATVLVIYLWTL